MHSPFAVVLFALRLVAAALAFIPTVRAVATIAGAPAPAPRVAISPLIPPGADDGLDQGLAFAELLAVRLSGDARWELVERAALPLVEQEWALKSSPMAGRAESLRIGALSRADIFLECRVSDPTVEHPWCSVAVVETARAEVLAERKIELHARPMGPWYRSPPERDLDALARTARDLLENACVRLAERHGRPVVALLFAPPAGEAGATEAFAALATLAETLRAAGCRWVDLVPGEAAESEALLHLLGYTDAARSPWEAAADVYLWVDTTPEGATTLRAWRPGLSVRGRALSDAATFDATAMTQEILADLRHPHATPDAKERLAVAREFLRQARERWRAAGLAEDRDVFSKFGLRPQPSEAQLKELGPIHTLLAAAAFFALEDGEIQELRALLDIGLVPYPAKILMMQRYCAVADRFWVRADGGVDWRLCADSFKEDIYEPARFQKRRIAAAADVLAALPEEAWAPFGPLMESWLQTVISTHEDQDAALFRKLWPMAVRTLGDKLRKSHESGQSDIYTRMRMDWPGVLPELLTAAGPALFQPPPPLKFSPLNRPTERRGLTVRDREPRVVSHHKGPNGPGGSWQRVETLDNGTTRIVAIEAPPEAERRPPSGVSFAPPPPTAAARPAQPPVLEAANRGDWAEVKRLLDVEPPRPTPNNREANQYLSTDQRLLRAAVDARQIDLANSLLDAGVKPHNEDAPVFSSLWTCLGKLDAAGFDLYRRLDKVGARVGSEDHADPFVVFLDHQQHRMEFRKQVADHRREAGTDVSAKLQAVEERERLRQEAQALAAFQQLLDLRLRDIYGKPAIDRANEDGVTPLVRVIRLEWEDGLRALLRAGADLDYGHFEGTPTRRLLAQNPKLARIASTMTADTNRNAAPPVNPPTTTSAPDGATLVAALIRKDSALLKTAALTPEALRYRDTKSWTVLHHAIGEKDEPFARRLISAGAPLDVLTSGGQSPLAFAAAQRMEDLVAVLLAAGADVNLRSGDGPTPLFQAAFSQNPSLVRRLIAAGARLNITAEDNGRTILHAAASRADNVAILEVLFEAGENFRAVSPGGYTALDWALANDAVENVPYLHAKGVGWRKRAPEEASPLRRAAAEGKDRMVRALLECGLWDEHALSVADTAEIKVLLEDAAARRGSKIAEDIALWPVICADRENGVRRAEAHLAAGGNVNYADPRGWGPTPLEMALREMNPALVRHLLDQGAVARVGRGNPGTGKLPTLWALRAPFWLSHPRHQPPGSPPPFETTMEAWDAYAAEMIPLIAPRWADPHDAELFKIFETHGQPRSAAALRVHLRD
jgi:ankyrin repeat protein